MIKFFISKSLYLLLMLFLISIISFGVVYFAPNSFFNAGELNPNISQESIEQLKSIYGLDKPLFEQYILWFKSIISLDFGISYSSGKFVKDEILERLLITLILNLVSMLLIFIFSLYLGIKSAIKTDSIFDKFTKQLSLLSFSMPSFYLALLLLYFLSLTFGLFPISGLTSTPPKDGFAYYMDMVWHLSLPIFIITFGGIGSLTLYIRSLTIEIMKSDYIFFAKARGIGDFYILKYYIFPNLSPSVVTILGLSLPSIIGGSVILESIFGISGMGLLFYQSAMSRDYPVILGILLIGAFLTLLGNILADLALLKLNPYFKKDK